MGRGGWEDREAGFQRTPWLSTNLLARCRTPKEEVSVFLYYRGTAGVYLVRVFVRNVTGEEIQGWVVRRGMWKGGDRVTIYVFFLFSQVVVRTFFVVTAEPRLHRPTLFASARLRIHGPNWPVFIKFILITLKKKTEL